MKILLTGSSSLLGRAVRKALGGEEVVCAGEPGWDVLDDASFAGRVLAERPEVIVHCATCRDVALCAADRAQAFRQNEEGVRNVALAAKMAEARLIVVSADAVFSGDPPREPWAWGELDIPRPQTVLGASLLAGERMVQMLHPDKSVILRVSDLYGAGGPSFVHELAREGATAGAALEVVGDQRFNPTSAEVVADVIRFLLARPDVSGVVHATCEDQCSPCDFAREFKRLLGRRFPRDVVPCAAASRPEAAQPLRNAALKKSVLNLLGYRTPNWKLALADFVAAEFGNMI